MSFEPVLFANTMFETANEAFLFCKGYLEEKGHADAAQHLEGLDPINAVSLGRLALKALYRARPLVTGDALEYVDIAINAMGRAVNPTQRPLHAVA